MNGPDFWEEAVGGRTVLSLSFLGQWSEDELLDRVEISSGICDVEPDDPNKDFYLQGAKVPRAPWRRPRADEARALRDPVKGHGSHTTVALVRPGDDPTAEVRRRIVALDARRRAVLRSPSLMSEVDRLVASLIEGYFVGDVVKHGLDVNTPGLPVCTIDRKEGGLTGLHVDSWGADTVNARAASPVRLNINLGPDSRYFLFLPLSLESMVELLRKGGEEATSPARFCVSFLERFDGCPMLRVRIDPGEAYVAATDAMVHDASSAGAKRDTFFFQMRGNLRPELAMR